MPMGSEASGIRYAREVFAGSSAAENRAILMAKVRGAISGLSPGRGLLRQREERFVAIKGTR